MTFDVSRIRLLLTEELSPHKLALVALISLYCSDDLPKSKLVKVLTTLVEFLTNKLVYNKKGDLLVVPEIKDLCNALKKSTSPDSETDDGKSFRNAVNEASFLERILLAELWKITSIDDLDMYIRNAYDLLVEPSTVCSQEFQFQSKRRRFLSSKSFLGSFLLKILTTYSLLNFDEELLLFEAFIDYREPSRNLYLSLGGILPSCLHVSSMNNLGDKNQRKPFVGNEKPLEESAPFYDTLTSRLQDALALDVSHSSLDPNQKQHKVIMVPIHDIRSLLDNQIEILEKFGTKCPKQVREIMNLMTSSSFNISLLNNNVYDNLPSYYYVKFLECLYELDYEGSLKYLHQYFDYMVSNNSKYFYHFALISRASLHQRFGEDEKALDAIQEAISVARENKDNSTLTYILSWLFNLMKNKPELWQSQTFYHNNNELNLLGFLVKKSQTVSLLLYAMNHHFETLHIMNSGDLLSKYFESLLKGNFISINDGPASFIKSAELAATVWSRVGIPHLAYVYNDVALICAKDLGNFIDEVSLKVRHFYLEYNKGDTTSAYEKLENLIKNSELNSSLFKLVHLRKLVLLVKSNFRKGNFKIAEVLMDKLMCTEFQDIEISTELVLLNAELQLYAKNYSKGIDCLANFLSGIERRHSKIQINLHTIIRIKLLKCQLYNVSGSPSRALILLVNQIQLGHRMGLLTIVIEGILILISVLNNMEYFEDSFYLLNSTMPNVLALEDNEFISTAYYELAKTCFNLISLTNDYKRIGLPNKHLAKLFYTFVESSKWGFTRAQDLVMLKECHIIEDKMATISINLGNEFDE